MYDTVKSVLADTYYEDIITQHASGQNCTGIEILYVIETEMGSIKMRLLKLTVISMVTTKKIKHIWDKRI